MISISEYDICFFVSGKQAWIKSRRLPKNNKQPQTEPSSLKSDLPSQPNTIPATQREDKAKGEEDIDTKIRKELEVSFHFE
jgi:hypothetical protein